MSGDVLDFGGRPDRLSLYVECLRLMYGYQLNPAFASEISRIDPLPHQRIAVYERMLREDRLRFLLADDAGAGKTIMTGLYVREMLLRKRIQRVLIIPPAGLVGNWERELRTLFRLRFRIVAGSDIRRENPFASGKCDLAIVSLDTIRGRAVFGALSSPNTSPYDLVVFDEAHKLSASVERGRARKTQRYKFAEAIAGCPPSSEYADLLWSARHLLLLTATPHMGKDSPYHHLWRLLDHRMFGSEEAFRSFPNAARASYFIRRTKEEMVDFQGQPIFRKRRCDTFSYDLSDDERALYNDTTAYLKHSYSATTGNQQAVRLAMGVFQRRLASSTFALRRSFERRIKKVGELISKIESGRIDARSLLRDQQNLNRRHGADYFDIRDSSDDSREQAEDYEDAVLGAVIAVTVEDLRAELETLDNLLDQARRLTDAGLESKFQRLQDVLEDSSVAGEKWLVFSEHRDTVDYLARRLEELGYGDQVATIHGAMAWDERERQVDLFRKPSGARFLIATDAAGEGINLQFCRLMVNYDIPWNPARLEQRMGRIHRYGQKNDVRIVNLVSDNTREGRVLTVLLERLDAIREELASDKVFDVIGRLFRNESLRSHMREALTADGEEQARSKITSTLSADAVKVLDDQARRRYAPGGDVKRRLDKLRTEVRRERYLHLLPGSAHRFLAHACSLLKLRVDGDPNGTFSLRPAHAQAAVWLTTALDAYPEEARECLVVRRPADDEPCVWLHPGEPVFDAIHRQVTSACQSDARRGGIFVDSRAAAPYLLHLGKLSVVEEARGSEKENRAAGSSGPRLIAQDLVALRQAEDGAICEASVESFGFLREAPHVPPGRIPLAAHAKLLGRNVMDRVEEMAQEKVRANREAVEAELPERRRRMGINFNQMEAELLERLAKLKRSTRPDLAGMDKLREKLRDLNKERKLARLELESAPARISPGPVRLLAVALVTPPTTREDADAFGLKVEEFAMETAIKWEQERGARVWDVSTPAGARKAGLASRYPGFDLLAEYPDGEKRHIEVKGRAETGDIYLEANEYRAACTHGRSYWLYVVLGCATAHPDLKRVRDPFEVLVAAQKTRMRISARAVREAAES